MKTSLQSIRARLLLCALAAAPLPAADAQSSTQYGQARPGAGATVETVFYHDGREEIERTRHRLELERLDLERYRLRWQQANAPQPAPVRAAAILTPEEAPAIGFRDRNALHQIERDIERISTSSIGTPQDRQLQVDALAHQRDRIYGSYGVPLATTVTIQVPHAAPGYYPLPRDTASVQP